MKCEDCNGGNVESAEFSQKIIKEIITEMEDEKLLDQDTAHQISKLTEEIAVIFRRYMN